MIFLKNHQTAYLVQFLDIVQERFPIINDQLEIQEFPQIVLGLLGPSESVGNQVVVGDMERILIQFFW